MKKITLFLLLLNTTLAMFSQGPTVSDKKNQINYRERSKNQKTCAILLLGGGALSATIGGLIWWRAEFEYGIAPGRSRVQRDQNVSTGKAFVIVGGVMMLGSIPLFIASNKNKHMSIVFKNQMIPGFKNNSFAYQAIPSLSLKIRL